MLLDRFIKDTTHELNTPLSTILANIEMMDREVMAKKNLKKLDRINSAAKAVSVLYKDLTYLTLEQHKNNNDEEINLKELIKERCEYFDILAKSKNITFELDLQDANILIDRNKITRVIDNLISNAIKYNKRNGIIQITTKNSTLIIQDSGIGIAKDKIPYMFDSNGTISVNDKKYHFYKIELLNFVQKHLKNCAYETDVVFFCRYCPNFF